MFNDRITIEKQQANILSGLDSLRQYVNDVHGGWTAISGAVNKWLLWKNFLDITKTLSAARKLYASSVSKVIVGVCGGCCWCGGGEEERQSFLDNRMEEGLIHLKWVPYNADFAENVELSFLFFFSFFFWTLGSAGSDFPNGSFCTRLHAGESQRARLFLPSQVYICVCIYDFFCSCCCCCCCSSSSTTFSRQKRTIGLMYKNKKKLCTSLFVFFLP